MSAIPSDRTSAKPAAAKTNIVICGYPKSGTTWLSRLVAELVGCPLRGDLGLPEGVRPEGQGRQSDYDCYKTHRTLASLASSQQGDSLKLIYIVRDPRDVAISATHHFRANLLPVRGVGKRILTAANARLSRVVPYALKRARMISAVLYGDRSISPWLEVPWRDHYREFRRSGTFVVKYEDLLDDPVKASRQLLSHLGTQRSGQAIADAISNQSFRSKQILFASQGMQAEVAFLRRGSYGYWRDELGAKHKQLFIDRVGEELRALSYPLE